MSAGAKWGQFRAPGWDMAGTLPGEEGGPTGCQDWGGCGGGGGLSDAVDCLFFSFFWGGGWGCGGRREEREG